MAWLGAEHGVACVAWRALRGVRWVACVGWRGVASEARNAYALVASEWLQGNEVERCGLSPAARLLPVLRLRCARQHGRRAVGSSFGGVVAADASEGIGGAWGAISYGSVKRKPSPDTRRFY